MADVLTEHPTTPERAADKTGPAAFESFENKVAGMLPEGGNLSLCLSCGACSASCPATGLEDMDPRKFLRMASLGMDKEVTSTPWVWQCSMCMRCVANCPMQINIPQLVYHARQAWPRERRPRGILQSCDAALKNPGNSAMGASSEDFAFVVEDVLNDVRAEAATRQEAEARTDAVAPRDPQSPAGEAAGGAFPDFRQLQAPIDKVGAYYFLNQNSREPVTEPEEMPPLWKILHMAGADWTYSSSGWAAENYCMFASDDKAWEAIVRNKVQAVERLKCSVWLNTE